MNGARGAAPDGLPPAVSLWPPAAAVLAVAGGMVAFTGAGTGSLPLAVAGGAVALTAVTLLVAEALLDGLALLALSLPLPALITSDFARIPPAPFLTAAVIVAWFLRGVATRPGLRPLPHRSTLAFVLAVVLATAFASHRVVAARELVNLLLMIGLLVAATGELARSPGRIRKLARVVAVTAGLAGIAAALEAMGMIPGRFRLIGTSFFRATAGFGWPNELGMFLAVALPVAAYGVPAARTAPGKVAALVLLAGAGAGLVATFSRGSWLAVLTAAPILFLAGDWRLPTRLLLGFIVGAVILDVALGGAIRERALATIEDPYVVQRAALMFTGVLMFLAHPIVGVGPGGFAESLSEFGPQVPWLWDYVGSSHNAYIEVAAETGILGLAGFLALLGSTLWILLKSARREAWSEPIGVEITAPTSDAPSHRRRPVRGLTLRRTLLWSFAVVCTGSFTVWPFAHGVGQLAMLVAAMGLALAGRQAPGAWS